MDGLTKILLTFLGLTFLGACVPTAKKSSCADGEVLNETLRSCVSASVINANNIPPVGVDQSETVTEDVALNFTISPATDANGDVVNYLRATNPTKGTITNCMNFVGSTGLTDRTCTYTPSSNLNGSDSFTYSMNDGIQTSTQNATVTFFITAVDDAPTVTLQAPMGNEDTLYTYNLFKNINYTDPEGDSATSCSVTSTTNMAVSGAPCSCSLGNCTVSFQPSLNLNTPGSTFSFSITLVSGTTSTAFTETMTIWPVNDRPTISTPAVCTTPLNQDSAISCPTQPIATDPDIFDGNPQTLTWFRSYPTNSCGAWAAIAGATASTATISGTPTDNDVSACNITYYVQDDSGSSNSTSTTSSFAMTISNLAPNLIPFAALTNPAEDSTETEIATVSDLAGCTSQFCLTIDDLQYGDLEVGAGTTCETVGAGTFRIGNLISNTRKIYFTPTANYASPSASCTLELEFSDGNGGIDTATALMFITEKNDAPTLSLVNNTTLTTNESTEVAADVFTIDEGGGVDENVQNLTITVKSDNTTLLPNTSSAIQMYSDSNYTTTYNYISTSASGVVYDTTDGDNDSVYLVFNPAPGQSGTANIDVTVTDNGTDNGVANPLSSTTSRIILTVTNNGATHNDWIDLNAFGAKILYDGTGAAAENPKVVLKWNDFTIVNDTIAGYKVFRSTSLTGPFVTPISGLIASGTNTYTDTTLSTADAGQNYYYKVMAISAENSKVIDSDESFSTIRIPIPLPNMVLVHRRVANLSTCTAMGKTPDPVNNNRCSYVGVGDNYSNYYDIGNDYLVDRYEASCNYTVESGICGETGGAGCIGRGVPQLAGADNLDSLKTVTTAGNSAIYYNRSTGICYFSDAGAAWEAISSLDATEFSNFAVLNQTTQASDVIETTFPKRPPLIQVHQYRSHNYCKEADLSSTYGASKKSLISRQVHMAAAEWSSTVTSPSTTEIGASLSLTVKECNSTSGGVLPFQNGLISALFDVWTGTEVNPTVSPRFVMSGSDVTSSCESRFGAQDLIGNVEEWNLDRFHSYSNQVLNPVGMKLGSGGTNPNETLATYMLLNSYNPYSYKSSTADAESTGDMTGTGAIASFDWSTGGSGLTSFFSVLGLPTSDTTDDDTLNSAYTSFNSDYFYLTDTLNGAGDLTVANNELIGVASGGKFDDGSGAGRFTMRLRQVCHDTDGDNDCSDGGSITAAGTELNQATGFRCMFKVP